ncbi:MAG TPA: RNA polymerase sigma factor [Chitinophagaceae bacterium]|jgi:RNA polymerase sigma-70 factor (ECF subfamily)|nr:RNA polymerase sigma factor [Chitinophagaceae bacterium]
MRQSDDIKQEELAGLIQNCLDGNRQAQSALYAHYADRMMGTCLWYASSREEAEEILQDGFVRVFTYLHSYKGKGSLEGWVRKIMINAALSRYRNKATHLYVVTNIGEEEDDIPEPGGFETNYDVKVLLQLIQSLPPVYRLVFNLYVFEGYSHKEIADMLGIAQGTSKSNLSDARRLLKASLQEMDKKIMSG